MTYEEQRKRREYVRKAHDNIDRELEQRIREVNAFYEDRSEKEWRKIHGDIADAKKERLEAKKALEVKKHQHAMQNAAEAYWTYWSSVQGECDDG